MRGLAMPSFFKALEKAPQVKLLRLPPRRFSHLNAHSVVVLAGFRPIGYSPQ